METKRYKPLTDRMFLYISVPTVLILTALTVAVLIYPTALAVGITLLTDLLVLYFLISPLFGYVELREHTLFIKLGFIMKREIPYAKIRGTEKQRKFYSDSMLSLKNSFDHVNVKYNRFDMISVSVVNNDEFVKNLEERINNEQSV